VRGQAFVGDDFKVKVLRDGKEESLTGKLLRKNPEGLPRLALSLRPRRELPRAGRPHHSRNSPCPSSRASRRLGGPAPRSASSFITSTPTNTRRRARRRSSSSPARSPRAAPKATSASAASSSPRSTTRSQRPRRPRRSLQAPRRQPPQDQSRQPEDIWLDSFMSETDNMQLLKGVYRLDRLKRIE